MTDLSDKEKFVTCPEGRVENLVPHQFKPGQTGNPGGKSSEQKRAEQLNAELATKLRGLHLAAQLEAIQTAFDPETMAILDHGAITKSMSGDLLRLLKDSEDRGYGAPLQPFREETPTTDDEQTARMVFLMRKQGIADEVIEQMIGQKIPEHLQEETAPEGDG